MAGPYDLAGTGIQAVAQPAALIVTATHLGTRVTQGTANPPNYRNIGQLTPGDADGWYGAVPIRVSPQKIVLQAGVTQLGYGLLAGSTVHVVEVPPPPVLNSSLNPWDRGPSVVASAFSTALSGGAASTTLWIYTVPANKLLLVSKCRAWMHRLQTCTSASSPNVQIVVTGGLQIALAVWVANVVGATLVDEHDGDMILSAGTQVTATAANPDTGGQIVCGASLSGTLFNA